MEVADESEDESGRSRDFEYGWNVSFGSAPSLFSRDEVGLFFFFGFADMFVRSKQRKYCGDHSDSIPPSSRGHISSP